MRYLTHPRELEDSELIEIAKLQDEKMNFGESEAYYKLYNTKMGAVFYFENKETRRSIECLFEMEMENLYIVDEPAGANKFTIRLAPGANAYKMLKPVDDGEATAI